MVAKGRLPVSCEKNTAARSIGGSGHFLIPTFQRGNPG